LASTFQGFIEHLRDIGLPIDRASFHSPQLDAQILGRSTQWSDGKVETFDFEHGIEKTDFSLKSPVWQIYQGRKSFIRQRLQGPGAQRDYPISEDLAEEGFADYVMFSIPFSNGRICAFSIATRKPEGFSRLEISAVETTLKAFGAVAELRHSRQTAAKLMDTYLGHGAGERVLKGQIKRGDVEEIHAVILFCDMRDSTVLSETLSAEDYLRLLNDYFDAVGHAVESRGGEVLKFIGDGLLAIFPCERNAASDCDAADRAIWAVEAALQRLIQVSKPFEENGCAPLRVGFALHVGDVMYGNVGASNRLDFTVTGPAVNKVSRLESLSKETGEAIIVSEEMKKRSGRLPNCFKNLGEVELRGIQGKHKAYAIDRSTV
jgi:adenylate cyclase